MKKTISFILIIIFLLTLTACTESSPDSSLQANVNSITSEDKITVITTIFPPYDFVREVAFGGADGAENENLDITLLLPPGSETHSFEPTPQDMIKIQNCDLFIYGGGESDEWVRMILDSVDTSSITIISMMDVVRPVEKELVEGMQEEEDSEDHDEALYDEHVWTSPRNAKLIVSAISSALCQIDSEREEAYLSNTENYLHKLDELDKAFQNVVANGTRNTIVFGDRFPFRYFADAYGLEYYAAFPGCSTETEPSAQTVAFLIDMVKKQKIPVIFHIEFSNERMADAISEGTGAKKLLFHSCHNVSKDDINAGTSYYELMNQNLKNLEEALQ